MSDESRRYPAHLEARFQVNLERLEAGEDLELPGWERLALLERLSGRQGDAADLAARLLENAPFRDWQLDDALSAAIEAGNEGVALEVLRFGVGRMPLAQAASRGLAQVVGAMIEKGARINRIYKRESPPLHLAASAASGGAATCRVLVEACCDLTARDAEGRSAEEIASLRGDEELAGYLREATGVHGPAWFREAQKEKIDHFVLYESEGFGFGFNPNDVQTPLLTGGAEEGFGWPTSVGDARAALANAGSLRFEVEWFNPFLDLLERGEDFSLEALEAHLDEIEIVRRR